MKNCLWGNKRLSPRDLIAEGSLDEQALITAILAGDAGAEEAFDGAFRRRLFVTAAHFLGFQDPEIEDVVQETLLLAHQKLAGFGHRSSLYLWLNHICVNFCLRRLQKRHRQVAAPDDEIAALSLGAAHEAVRRQDEALLGQERQEALQAALKGMAKDCRQVMEQRHLQGLSYIELGRELKLPIGTVMSRLARCRERLKETLRLQGALR